MKKKILSLLAAFFMLFGTSAMAQVDSTLEGDVNGDGVVDIADITAVIAIIKQNAEANPTYYWYAGQTKPTSMTGNPTSDDTNFTNNKWHTLTASQINKTITGGTSGQSWYVAVPTSKNMVPVASDMQTKLTWATPTNITINNIKYDVWTSTSTSSRTTICMNNL